MQLRITCLLDILFIFYKLEIWFYNYYQFIKVIKRKKYKIIVFQKNVLN